MVMPVVGVISYTTPCGTFTFSAFAKSRLRINPLSSRSGTTTRGVEYTLSVEDYVISANGVDAIDDEMEDWKRILTTRCGRLIYSGRGCDLDVNNPAGAVRDIGSNEGLGPIPKLGEFYSLGGSKKLGAKVSWQVTTVIPQCCGETAYSNQLSDVSYEIAWRLDEGGRQNRTISGIIEIPVTRFNGARVPSDQADAYRDRIEKALPMLPGFKRTRDFKLSADRRTESFTITDREQDPTAFQQDIEEWHGEQSTRTMLVQKGFTLFTNRIAASFRVQLDKPKAIAWQRFGAIVGSRVAGPLQKRNPDLTLFASLSDAIKRFALIPLDLEVRDSLHNQEVSFSFSYQYVSDIVFFLRQAGMWEPLPNGDWQGWKDNAGNGAASERGYSQLVYEREKDAIVDLCVKKEPPPQFGRIKNAPKPLGAVKADTEVRQPPPPEKSFLAYEAHMRFIGDAGWARHKPLSYSPKGMAPVNELDVNAKTHMQQGSSPTDVIQSVGSSTCTVMLYGSAVRAGYAVVPPKILSIGGVEAILDYEDIDNAEIGNAGSLPIFGGRWTCIYLLPQTPSSNLAIPKNRIVPDSANGAGVERV